MAEIQKATITLKLGDYVDAFILVKGQLVEVRIQADSSSQKPTPPKSPIEVTPVHFHGDGGHQALEVMTIHSGENSSDIAELLANVADEDSTQLGEYTVERDHTGAGRVVLHTSLESEISLGMKDLGGL